MAKARMTPAPTREEMHAYRLAVMEEVNGLVAELHDCGFSRVSVESVQISGDNRMYQRVVIDMAEIGWEWLDRINSVAAMRLAKVSLMEFRENGHSFSRIALWPNTTAVE